MTTAPLFEWSLRKERLNRRKHGVSFDEARTVFYDEAARLIADPGHSDEEERFIIVGMSDLARVLLVCHCWREGDRVIRIISARRAVPFERAQYEGFLSGR